MEQLMEKSRWQQYKEKLGDTKPWDLINPNTEWANEEDSNKRYDICRSCSELIKLTKQCKQCGCVMAAKVKLQNAKCPLGKW
jgi:hypothetical protein